MRRAIANGLISLISTLLCLVALPTPRRPTPTRSLRWRYTRHAILYMREVSRRGGATLVVVPLTPHQPDQFRILRNIAAEYGLPFLDTSSLDATDTSLWLQRDGHLSSGGARRLAELESAFLARWE